MLPALILASVGGGFFWVAIFAAIMESTGSTSSRTCRAIRALFGAADQVIGGWLESLAPKGPKR